MYVHIWIFMYMSIACTYMFMLVRNLVNMYIHVCTMYRDVCTDLPILVQVVRIPDEFQSEVRSAGSWWVAKGAGLDLEQHSRICLLLAMCVAPAEPACSTRK